MNISLFLLKSWSLSLIKSKLILPSCYPCKLSNCILRCYFGSDTWREREWFQEGEGSGQSGKLALWEPIEIWRRNSEGRLWPRRGVKVRWLSCWERKIGGIGKIGENKGKIGKIGKIGKMRKIRKIKRKLI